MVLHSTALFIAMWPWEGINTDLFHRFGDSGMKYHLISTEMVPEIQTQVFSEPPLMGNLQCWCFEVKENNNLSVHSMFVLNQMPKYCHREFVWAGWAWFSNKLVHPQLRLRWEERPTENLASACIIFTKIKINLCLERKNNQAFFITDISVWGKSKSVDGKRVSSALRKENGTNWTLSKCHVFPGIWWIVRRGHNMTGNSKGQ